MAVKAVDEHAYESDSPSVLFITLGNNMPVKELFTVELC